MDESNIVAIPRHPPLPHNVSGMFQGAEPPYTSAQASKSSTISRDSSTSAAYYSEQPLRHQQFQPRQTHYEGQQLFASNTESHSRSTYRPRASTGFSFNQPTDYSAAGYAVRDGSVFSVQDGSSFGNSNGRQPSYLPRRDSATSFNITAMSQEIRHAPSNMFSPNMPLISALSHTRRQSIDSCISDTRSTGKNSISSGAERKYTCDWHDCGQAFDRVEHLNRHKRRHTGEKPYRCLVSKCTKLFSRFDNMMQHVGIHCIEGAKTEVPNIKNLNSRCNGRGRVRRTSYRGTQDSYDKFRRHVETSLGHGLAECCILPTKNPDFSNLTLRPLINDMLPDTNSEETPLWETVGLSSADPSLSQAAKRFRRDSVVDDMDRHMPTSSVNNYHNTSPLSGSSEALSSPEGKRTRLSAASHGSQPNGQMQHLANYPPPPERARTSATGPLYTDDGMARTTNINGYYYPQQHQHRHKPTHTVFTSSIQRPSLSNEHHHYHSGYNNNNNNTN
ncbi:Up in starvation [Kickxella alabastrina]|nr:Up in starvation [Kickxella alabastrina]